MVLSPKAVAQPEGNDPLETCLQAAETGKADALYNLGLLYSTGRHVARDNVAAHKWLNLAALKGDLRAVKDRCELARDMSRTELREALRQAREWMLTH